VALLSDQLLFLDARGRRLYMAGWTGPWPPPERLLVMVGQSGYVSVVEEDTAPPEALVIARALGTITELRFRLRNASAIVEPAPEDAHWFRGAEYVPVTDD
jgi:hypothetical protein